MERSRLMHRQPVESSAITSVGYEKETQILELEFHSGNIYRYSNVPEMVYQGLLIADSIGSYFSEDIRDEYPTERIK